mgnify:CR=1 FL=1
MSTAEKVTDFLECRGGSWRQVLIAKELGLNKSSVRSAIFRLKKGHKIVPIDGKRGFYAACSKAREELDDQLKSLVSHSPDILPMMHGLVLSVKSPNSWKTAIRMNWHQHTNPMYLYKSFDTLLCENIELHVFTNDTVEFFVSATRRPLDYERFVKVMCFLDGIFLACFNFSLIDQMSEVSVHKIEWNKDFQNIKLDGLKSITLSEVTGIIEKIYNKDGKLRKETILTDRAVQMKLGDVMEAVMKGGVGDYYLKQTLGIIAQDQKYVLQGIKVVLNENRTIGTMLNRIADKLTSEHATNRSQSQTLHHRLRPIEFGRASESMDKSRIFGPIVENPSISDDSGLGALVERKDSLKKK